MKHSKTEKKLVGTAVFLVYLCVLMYFLFYSSGLGREAGDSYQYNLIPFHEIGRFLAYTDQIGKSRVILNLCGNVAAFVPFGAYLIFISDRITVTKAWLITACFSAMIECIQLFTRVGSFDVDDIILNTFGGLIGALIYMADRVGRKRSRRRRKR